MTIWWNVIQSLIFANQKNVRISLDSIWDLQQRFLHFVLACLLDVSTNVFWECHDLWLCIAMKTSCNCYYICTKDWSKLNQCCLVMVLIFDSRLKKLSHLICDESCGIHANNEWEFLVLYPQKHYVLWEIPVLSFSRCVLW